ncbi:MAG TPA: AgmX/PglI C-terminal domain-containing protein [Kofleriaceae bacterium]|nr:AgmX/PglI C-terminal domain-containing protein [Kofleriaceae bacterium]
MRNLSALVPARRGLVVLVGIAAAALGGCGGGNEDILPSGPRVGTGPEGYERGKTRVRDVIQVRSKGHLEPHELEAGVSPHRAALGDCYLRRLGDHKFLRGDLVLQAVIESTGQVGEARIIESDVGDWVVERCVIDEARTMRFDPPRGGKQVVFSVPLHFASDQPPMAIWAGPRTAASAARHTRELDACAGAARVPPPGEVTVTMYVTTDGAVAAIGFGSDHPSPVHEAWADCAARTIGRWVFDDPGEQMVKESFPYRPKQP